MSCQDNFWTKIQTFNFLAYTGFWVAYIFFWRAYTISWFAPTVWQLLKHRNLKILVPTLHYYNLTLSVFMAHDFFLICKDKQKGWRGVQLVKWGERSFQNLILCLRPYLNITRWLRSIVVSHSSNLCNQTAPSFHCIIGLLLFTSTVIYLFEQGQFKSYIWKRKKCHSFLHSC